MYRALTRTCLFVAVAVGSGHVAQGQGMIGSSGMSAFGGGIGTGGFGTSSFGSAGFGASRFGGAGFGQSGFGTGGFGSAGFGASRFGGTGIGGGFGMGASPFGNQSYGMGGYGGGQAFIGRDAGDMAAVATQLGRAGTQLVNQMNRNISRRARDRQPAQSNENAPQLMRVALQVAFEAPRPTPVVVATSLRTRLGKILADHDIAQPAVTMDGDTAVLRGIAATESQRLVLEKLVALEPGVRQVRNEMTVIARPSASVLPPQDN